MAGRRRPLPAGVGAGAARPRVSRRVRLSCFAARLARTRCLARKPHAAPLAGERRRSRDAAATGACGDGQPPARGGGGAALRLRRLPFPNQSLDLVVLPHTLELTRDPHQALAEVERVLMPEGRVVILGFNPTSRGACASGWAVCAKVWRWARKPLFLPAQANSSATGGCATGCGCWASRSSAAASAVIVRRSVRNAGLSVSAGWNRRATAGGRCSERCTSSSPSSGCVACGWWDWRARRHPSRRRRQPS